MSPLNFLNVCTSLNSNHCPACTIDTLLDKAILLNTTIFFYRMGSDLGLSDGSDSQQTRGSDPQDQCISDSSPQHSDDSESQHSDNSLSDNDE